MDECFYKDMDYWHHFFRKCVSGEDRLFLYRAWYWCCRLFSVFISGSSDDEVEFFLAANYIGTMSKKLSPQQTLRFLLGQDSSDFYENWNQVKNSTFKGDELSLLSNIKTMELTLVT